MPSRGASVKVTEPEEEASRLRTDMIDAIVRWTVDTFRVQANTPVQFRAAVPRNSFKSSEAELAAVVEVETPHTVGTASLHFGQKTLLGVVSQMIGEVCDGIDADIESAVTELLNIIFTNAQGDLNSRGYEVQPAIPSFLPGQLVARQARGEGTVLSFESSVGSFHVELFLAKREWRPNVGGKR